MASSEYTTIVLNERPLKETTSTTFRTETAPLNLKPGANQVLVQVQWLSVDPALRGHLNDTRSYMPSLQIGEKVRANGIGVVIETGPGSMFEVGQTVRGILGWTEYTVVNDKDLYQIVVPPGAELLDFLHTLGSSGMTAYFGVKDLLQLKQGETLVVSGAAGSVGAIVCQLAKKIGARVFAIAGSQDKCDWLYKELEVDKALNYKSESFASDFKSIGYVDAYFDNVGGEILDMVLGQMNINARIALCGAISLYNGEQYGLKNYRQLIIQRAKMEGFIVIDYRDRYPEAVKEISKGIADGSIKRRFHVVEGLAEAPNALKMLFSGENTGKMIVKVSKD